VRRLCPALNCMQVCIAVFVAGCSHTPTDIWYDRDHPHDRWFHVPDVGYMMLTTWTGTLKPQTLYVHDDQPYQVLVLADVQGPCHDDVGHRTERIERWALHGPDRVEFLENAVYTFIRWDPTFAGKAVRVEGLMHPEPDIGKVLVSQDSHFRDVDEATVEPHYPKDKFNYYPSILARRIIATDENGHDQVLWVSPVPFTHM
jgi:hypothetical protein